MGVGDAATTVMAVKGVGVTVGVPTGVRVAVGGLGTTPPDEGGRVGKGVAVGVATVSVHLIVQNHIRIINARKI